MRKIATDKENPITQHIDTTCGVRPRNVRAVGGCPTERKNIMDNTTLEKMAVTAFAKLTDARSELFTATETAIEAKDELEFSKYKKLNSGQIDGKNAEIREAQLRDALSEEFSYLAEVEAAERKARFDYDLASVEVDTVKTLLRIAELK